KHFPSRRHRREQARGGHPFSLLHIQMTRTAASEELSPTELAEFREIFDLVDRDGGGTVTKEELGELMDTLGIEATPEEVDLMIDEIDQDNNGEIDFEEFVAVMSRKVNASYTADQVKRAFKVFEGTSPPGHIKIDSVMKALTNYGSEQLTEEQAHDLVSQLEPDHNGVVNYVEYINMV
ncbi:unnamed protein product, partial [Hapterophycus canaliculatus]